MADLDADRLRAASYRNMAEHLSGPFTAGAVDEEVALDNRGRARIEAPTREPLLLLAPRWPLGSAPIRVKVTVRPPLGSAEKRRTVELTFAPYTEPGAALPVYRPDPARVDTRQTPPFVASVCILNPEEVPSLPLPQLFELRLLQGVMGRLLYVLGAEKHRIRRQARELMAVRSIPLAHDDALDRFGADLGVPRFPDQLVWDASHGPVTVSAPEPDERYRHRLALYAPLLVPSRRRLLTLLNGPGETGPNTGPLGALGPPHRFTVRESDAVSTVAIRLVSSPADTNDTQRRAFLQHARDTHLVAPESPGTLDRRLLPVARRETLKAILARLRERFTFPPGAHLAPALAESLDRLGRCLAALGVTRRLAVTRAQDDQGGSRFELGLGAEVESPASAELEAWVTRLQARDFTGAVDRETRALLEALTPLPPARDPRGRWLLAACGFETVHLLGNGRLYLSHLPIYGTVVELQAGAPLALRVRHHAPGDPGDNVALVHALADAEATRQQLGLAPWSVLSEAEAPPAWQRAQAPASQALEAFAAAGIWAPESHEAVASVVRGLAQVPPELMATLRFGTPQAAAILQGSAEGRAYLAAVIGALGRHGIASVLPLVTTTGEVLLTVAVTVLPGAATSLNMHRVGFHWSVVTLASPEPGAAPRPREAGFLTGNGGVANGYVANGGSRPGLAAVIAVGVTRRGSDDPRGRIDPYELQVGLESPTATINLPQYEFLMNLLDHAHPLGIAVDTSELRRRMEPIPGGGPVRLSPKLSRTYRPFRQRRHLGGRDFSTQD